MILASAAVCSASILSDFIGRPVLLFARNGLLVVVVGLLLLIRTVSRFHGTTSSVWWSKNCASQNGKSVPGELRYLLPLVGSTTALCASVSPTRIYAFVINDATLATPLDLQNQTLAGPLYPLGQMKKALRH